MLLMSLVKGARVRTFVIMRRNGWQDAENLKAAEGRSIAEGERMSEDIRWIRSYVLAEPDGSVGTVCIYEASTPEAIRRHADAAELPIDEIVAVAETVIVRSDA